jgi:hypothetical protein
VALIRNCGSVCGGYGWPVMNRKIKARRRRQQEETMTGGDDDQDDG